MELDDARATVSYLIRDRDVKFPPLFDEVLADAGIAVVLTGHARTNHRTSSDHPPRHPKTRPPRRNLARVQTRRLTSTDE
jgi:hypothetical protein